MRGEDLTTGRDYIGKTIRPLPKRMASPDHLTKTITGRPLANPVLLGERMTPNETAGVEALLIEDRGLTNLTNKIRGLDPSLPKNQPKIKAGKQVLRRK
jgi:hypothetical protein